MKLKLNRTQRQTEGLRKWSKAGFNGIFQYPTGFGKTYSAIRALLGMIKKKNINSAVIVVPTLTLQKQWNKELKNHKIKIAKVYVINTAAKLTFDIDLLILDEIHRYAAETFKLIFENTSAKYKLGLTATLERSDDLHKLILDHLKVVDTISVNEALKNRWISSYKVYNIAVPLPEEEKVAYRKANNGFKHFASKLGGRFDAFDTAQEWIKSDDKKEQGLAAAYYNSMRARKKICLNNTNKIPAINKLVNYFKNRNGLLFSSNTEFADNVQKSLGDIAMTFHSKIGKKDQKYVINRFKDKRTKIRILSTVKALNEGFDVPDASLGIIAGSTSSKLTFIQQLGRIVRFIEGKEAIMFNLYTPDTQEEVWVRKRTVDIDPELITHCTLEEFFIAIENNL